MKFLRFLRLGAALTLLESCEVPPFYQHEPTGGAAGSGEGGAGGSGVGATGGSGAEAGSGASGGTAGGNGGSSGDAGSAGSSGDGGAGDGGAGNGGAGSGGDGGSGGDAGTGGTDSTAPTDPSALSASEITATNLVLSWTAATDNVRVVDYLLYNGSTLIATVAAPTLSHKYTGLKAKTTYTLGVKARDAAHNESTLVTLAATTADSPDSSPPTAPTKLLQGTTTETSIVLSWTGSTDNIGVVGYHLYVDGTLLVGVARTSPDYTFKDLTANQPYKLGVSAYDAEGNESPVADIDADHTAPKVPTGLALGSTTSTSVALSWTASTDNVAVEGYRLYLDGMLNDSVASATTDFVFAGLDQDTDYELAVTAYDAFGNESAKATKNATTLVDPCAAPNWVEDEPVAVDEYRTQTCIADPDASTQCGGHPSKKRAFRCLDAETCSSTNPNGFWNDAGVWEAAPGDCS